MEFKLNKEKIVRDKSLKKKIKKQRKAEKKAGKK